MAFEPTMQKNDNVVIKQKLLDNVLQENTILVFFISKFDI